MDPYLLKQALLRPYAALVRPFVRVDDPIAKQILELYSYRPAMLLLWLRTRNDPDLLHRAPDVRVALDIGSYDGEWARQIHERYGATVFSFEPDPVAFENSRERLRACAGVHLMPFGL